MFDLLSLDGRDLAPLPLEQRKHELAALLARAGHAGGTLRYAEHVAGCGANVLAHACKLGLEGIVSKRRDLPYQPGRNASWQKSKCILRQEFVVGGFTEGEGRRQGIGSLLIGYYEGGALRFAGKVGNGPGFTAEYTRRLQREFERIEHEQCPFQPRPPGVLGKRARWVRPERVVEVSFSEWTEGGAARHPLLQGMRTDKAAQDVRREVERGGGEPSGIARAPQGAEGSAQGSPPGVPPALSGAKGSPRGSNPAR